METVQLHLSLDQIDALREVGNIGAGHAATALATILNKPVTMSVPHVGLETLFEFTERTDGPETESVCVYMPTEGDVIGHAAFLMDSSCAMDLCDLLLGRASGETRVMNELEQSVLMEIGNIITSSYLTALCDLTELQFKSTPPSIAIDMIAAILSSLSSSLSDIECVEDTAITITMQMGLHGDEGVGFFLFVPEPDNLTLLLRSLFMEV